LFRWLDNADKKRKIDVLHTRGFIVTKIYVLTTVTHEKTLRTTNQTKAFQLIKVKKVIFSISTSHGEGDIAAIVAYFFNKIFGRRLIYYF
jgi:hypothetical protein